MVIRHEMEACEISTTYVRIPMATPTTNLPMSTHQAFFRQEFKHLLAPLDMYYVIKIERQRI